jgi:hypothetical protein
MNILAQKFVGIESAISAEKGGFSLFALFLREDAENKWDVVVSAPWFGDDQKSTLDYFVRKIQSELRPDELMMVSRVILLDPGNEAVKAVNKAIRVEHGICDVLDSEFSGLRIKRGYIITSREGDPVTASAN